MWYHNLNPKAGKIRKDLKNWRPLTLLNSVCNFFSQIISVRIRSTLNFLIHPHQTGFIQGRYTGLLMVVDYSKAFDTMEWEFISKSLRLFNFGDRLINMVKLLQANSFSKIEQNVFFSEHIILERGCRQGDPVSPYLFVLSAEILLTIRRCEDVRGLRVGTKKANISLFADDTTQFLLKDKYTVKKL